MPTPLSNPRDVLTPDALAMVQRIAASGSFAAAARALGMVPSALTYRVRQIEEALDVLLFDRSTRQARLTEAGHELVREAGRLLTELDGVTHRVRRVATGWEPQLTLSVDTVIDRKVIMELCEAFYAESPPTRIRLRQEVLTGTLERLLVGQADVAIGVGVETSTVPGIQVAPLGSLRFAFVAAPGHPLAQAREPLATELIRQYRSVAIADSVSSGGGVTIGVLPAQDVFTVPDMPAKIEAQLRGLGVGFLPACVAAPYLADGRLVEKRVEHSERRIHLHYAWRKTSAAARGKALQWWLARLESPATRRALLHGE
ncbi:MAG TPA: LysR family transcriptional regulator [Burkholderiaceae bacterium]|jgi:DNA-binding transcriptional LysR family regulator|nr:LysR family transcriptional regulator [Burkholderiaceae bacterium]